MEPKIPSVSIIIPVLHEAAGINETIMLLRGGGAGPETNSEIIVVDGDPAGSTVARIGDISVRKVLSERGRAVQMNRGADAARGDILLFLHADTVLPPNAPALIRRTMDDQRIVAGAFDLGISSKRRLFRLTEQYVFFRTRLTRVPFGDQAIFIRRSFFRELGGYREIPLMEDVELMKRIRSRGGRIRIVPEQVSTSPRRYEREGVLFCTLRNWMIQALYALGVSPERLAKWYRPF